ncbi:MAG: Gfo/Idh/MocA family oxidoreductase [Candidatus Latescibacterota bacterium]
MATTYRAGIIGCGSISHFHYRGYKAVEAIEVAAVADPVAEARDEFGERYGIARRYADARRMLDQEHLDIVSVCTWHKLHAPLTIAACARRPKVVLCEKPMSVSLGDCDGMLIAARRNEVKLAVAHQRRFNAAWMEARRLVLAGAVGRPLHLIAKGGQGLLNDCSHYLDMMRYVMGDPAASWVMGNVERQTDRYERDVRIEDRSFGLIQFANGAQGLMEQELGQRNHDGRTYHGQGGVVHGSEGVLDFDETMVRLLNGQTGTWEERQVDGEDASIGQARALVDWIEGRGEHLGQAVNGRAAVEIIMAIYESARRHEVVSLPLTTHASPLEAMIEAGQLPVQRPGAYDIRAFLLRGEQMRPACYD